jgi:hypothetical protein
LEVQAATESAAAFLDELRGTWSAAAQAAGTETRSYQLAGQLVELRFAGSALIPALTRALAQLEVGESTGDRLVVRIWDSETTGSRIPPTPWGADDYLEYGKIRGFFDERFQSLFQWGSHSFVMLDLERGEAVYWVHAAGQIPSYETAAPLRPVLDGWLRSRGVELVHAAAVGSADGCVLLAGKSGAGKSSATLAAASSGLKVVSDDYCLLGPEAPARIESIYSSAKTAWPEIAQLPFLAGAGGVPIEEGEKAVYFLHEVAPESLLLDAELRAILIPRLTGGRSSELQPASASAALAALAPNTVLQLPAAGARTLRRLADISREVPSYFFDLGTDLASIGPAIERAL